MIHIGGVSWRSPSTVASNFFLVTEPTFSSLQKP